MRNTNQKLKGLKLNQISFKIVVYYNVKHYVFTQMVNYCKKNQLSACFIDYISGRLEYRKTLDLLIKEYHARGTNSALSMKNAKS